MNENCIDVPVLLMIFNRPGPTRKVFERIRQARPSKLYIAADGPRPDHTGEMERCQQTRRIVDEVDWKCEVHKLFREKNLGCKDAVRGAINWFFDNEEMGIVLEDDCLPEPSFFDYCQELLNRYVDDRRVMMVSGTSYLFDKGDMTDSYFFSNYYAIWGWATWRRAWRTYDPTMRGWPDLRSSDQLLNTYGDNKRVDYLKRVFDSAYDGRVSTWDIQWFFTCLTNGGLSASPRHNLISNIGVEGTHTGRGKNLFIEMPTKPIEFPLVHPSTVVADSKLDEVVLDTIIGQSKRTVLDHIRYMAQQGWDRMSSNGH